MLVKANYYTAINDLSNANQCYQNYLELNAKQVALENEQQIKNESISINVEQKELDLIAQDNANKRAELQEAKQKSFQAYLITSVLILIICALAILVIVGLRICIWVVHVGLLASAVIVVCIVGRCGKPSFWEVFVRHLEFFN